MYVIVATRSDLLFAPPPQQGTLLAYVISLLRHSAVKCLQKLKDDHQQKNIFFSKELRIAAFSRRGQQCTTATALLLQLGDDGYELCV